MTLVLTTEKGLQTAWRSSQPYLEELVEIETIDGRVIGPLNVSGIRIKSDTLFIELDQFTFNWQPSRLFKKVLDIDSISVDGLRVTLLKQASPAADQEDADPFILPDEITLPWRCVLAI